MTPTETRMRPLTTAEMADLLGVTRGYVLQLVQAGAIRAERPGHSRRHEIAFHEAVQFGVSVGAPVAEWIDWRIADDAQYPAGILASDAGAAIGRSVDWLEKRVRRGEVSMFKRIYLGRMRSFVAIHELRRLRQQIQSSPAERRRRAASAAGFHSEAA